ncbi:MAG TPA: NTPase [Candidatus Moranbacteria bacterium]|nr:NTPase [Candidatus Moranbacteria bacterium]
MNKYIEDYLDYYCTLKEPGYAVLIKGPWGAGKTWFIKKYIKKLETQKQKVLYVSLYGMTSFSEIEDILFQQLHPVLSSKKMVLAGKVMKGLLKTTLKIDLNQDSKEDVSVSSQVPDIDIPEYLKNTQNCIIVFDDLERCRLEIDNVMGYINHFIEHQGLRVMIVANEEEIESSDESSKLYLRIKEKLIGKTFEIKANFKEAVEDYIGTISNSEAKKFLKDNIGVVSEVYALSGYDNLRHLKQALWDFERLYLSLPESVRSNNELMLHLLKLLLVFSFEIRQGKIKATDIGKISDAYWGLHFDPNENGGTPLSNFIKKYNSLSFPGLLLGHKCWVDFLDKGTLDKEAIKEAVLSSVYYQDESTPDWKKLWYFRELTNKEYGEILKEVNKNYKKRAYDNLGIFKHIFGAFLRLSEAGLFKKSKATIIKEGEQYIKYLKGKNLLPKEVEEISSFYDSYDGLQFHSVDTAEFKNMQNYINEKIREANIEKMPDAGKNLLKIMREDINRFSRMIHICNSEEQIYYKIPILKYIKPKEFVAAFLSLKPADRRIVVSTFSRRYQFNDKELIEELDWLKSVKDMIEKQAKKKKGLVVMWLIYFLYQH